MSDPFWLISMKIISWAFFVLCGYSLAQFIWFIQEQKRRRKRLPSVTLFHFRFNETIRGQIFLPGWYWVKRGEREREVIKIIEGEDGKLYRAADDEGLHISLEFLNIDLWYGPLPVPELPKEEKNDINS